MIELKSVQSSNIAAVGYNEDDFRLYMLSRGTNGLWAYSDVPPEMYEEMMASDNIYTFYVERISGNRDHPSERILSYEIGALHRVTLDGQSWTPIGTIDTAITIAPPQRSLAIPDAPGDLRDFAEAARESLRTLTSAGVLRGMVVVSTPQEYELVGREAMRLDALGKAALAKIAPNVQAKHKDWKDAVAERDAILAPFTAAVQMANAGLAAYRQAAREKAESAQREADAAAKARSEAARAAAQEAAQTQSSDVAEAKPLQIAVPEIHLAPVCAPEIPQIEGQSVSQDWDYAIEDETLIPCSPDFWSVDPAKLRSYAKRMKQHAKVPGVRFYPKDIVRRRSKTA